MRALTALACFFLVVGSLAPAHAQNSKNFAGPLDRIQVESIQGNLRSRIPQVPAIPSRDLNTATEVRRPVQPATIDRPQFEREVTKRSKVSVAQLPVQATHQSEGFIFGDNITLDGKMIAGGNGNAMFHVPQDHINPQQAIIDANQYIYGDTSRDGLAFGFDNSRLYHPFEGPQLRLQGAQTLPLKNGACECGDEWEGFCRFKELDYKCGSCCGGNTTASSLGFPWRRGCNSCGAKSTLCKKGCRKCETPSCNSCSDSK